MVCDSETVPLTPTAAVTGIGHSNTVLSWVAPTHEICVCSDLAHFWLRWGNSDRSTSPACAVCRHLPTSPVQCKSCPVGTYQPSAGSRVCVKCPDNTYTAAVGATAASACSLTTRPVDYDAIAAELAAALLGGNSTLGNSNITAGSAGIGRRLLQSQDMVLCNALLNLFNVSASELGNGFCNHGPWNTVACGFDGGDCCEVTCSQPDMGNSTLQFSCAPLGLACRDPVAIGEYCFIKFIFYKPVLWLIIIINQ